jgi:hypothetical protein
MRENGYYWCKYVKKSDESSPCWKINYWVKNNQGFGVDGCWVESEHPYFTLIMKIAEIDEKQIKRE